MSGYKIAARGSRADLEHEAISVPQRDGKSQVICRCGDHSPFLPSGGSIDWLRDHIKEVSR